MYIRKLDCLFSSQQMGAKCSKAFSKPFTNLRKRWRKNKVEPLPQHLSSSRDPTPPLRKWPTQELAVEEAETEFGGDNACQGCIIKSDDANVEVRCPNYCHVCQQYTVQMTPHPVPQAIEEETKGRERREKRLRRVRFLLPPDKECGSVAEDTSHPDTPNTLPPLPPLMKRQTEEVTELLAAIDTTLSQLTQDLTHTEAVKEEDNVSLQFQEILGEEEDNDSVIFNDCDREKDVACPQPDDTEYDKWSMDCFIEIFLAEDVGDEISGKQETKTDGRAQSLTTKEMVFPHPDNTEYDSWSMEDFIESFLAEDFGLEEKAQAPELPVAKPMLQEPIPVNGLSLLLQVLDL